MRHAVVVGAGIGGLTAAMALRGEGWSVTVYERAPALEAVGAGLAVAPNGLRGLDAVGVGDRIRELAGFGEAAAGVRSHDGTWLVRTDPRAAEERWGTCPWSYRGRASSPPWPSGSTPKSCAWESRPRTSTPSAAW